MNVASLGVNIDSSTRDCCEVGLSPPWLKRVNDVCKFALGIFAAFLLPMPLAISLSIGTLAGSMYGLICQWKNLTLMTKGNSKPICAEGYMDYLSGVRFPPVFASLATAAFFAEHMRHDPKFYVPFCGIFVGFWIGITGVDLAGRAFSHFSRKTSC